MSGHLPPHLPGCEPCLIERERIAARWSRPQVEPLPDDVVAAQRNLRVAVEVRDGKTRVLVSLDGVLLRSVECDGSVAIEEVF